MADNSRLYTVLGVPKDADERAIKKAYRRLAQKYHPDVNKEPDAEAKFKEINAAHEVLSNPERRKLYDEYGEIALDPNFNPDQMRYWNQGGGAGAGGFSFEDLFGQGGGSGYEGFGGFGGFGFDDLFGGMGGMGGQYRQPQPAKGENIEASYTIDFMTSVKGGKETISFMLQEPDGRGGVTQRPVTYEVKIPAGIKPGQKIRLPGKGGPGYNGGPDGDLMIKIEVTPSSVFDREDDNILYTAKIDMMTALLGGTVDVPTLTGQVELKVPAGSQPGAKMRLKGKGVESSRGTGDEIVTLKVEIPKNLTEEQRAAFEEAGKTLQAS